MDNKPNMSSTALNSDRNITPIDTKDAKDVTLFVQTLLQQVQDKFQQMSDQILSRIDEMGHRIDDLEHNLNELVQQTDPNDDNNVNNQMLTSNVQQINK